MKCTQKGQFCWLNQLKGRKTANKQVLSLVDWMD